MVQKGFTLAIPIKPGQRNALSKFIIANKHRFDFRDELDTLNTGHQTNDSTILCSVVTIPAQSRKTGETLKWDRAKAVWLDENGKKVKSWRVLPPSLVVVSSYTGKTNAYLKELVDQNGEFFYDMFKFCAIDSVESLAIPKKMVRFLKLNNQVSTFYAGQQYITKNDIFLENSIYNCCREFLTKNQNELAENTAVEIKSKLLNNVLKLGNIDLEDLKFSNSFWLVLKAKWIGTFELLTLLFLLTIMILLGFWPLLPKGIAALLGFSSLVKGLTTVLIFAAAMIVVLLLIVVLYIGFLIILEQLTPKPKDKPIDTYKVRKLTSQMTHDVFNEFSLAGPVKSNGGWLRVFANYVSLKMALIGLPIMAIPTVVNARWVGMNGYKRFTFFSNFMSQTEGYAREFVDQDVRGSLINLIYHHANGYPKTKWIIGKGGRTNPESLVKTIFYFQHKTEFWYSPFRHLSNDNIKINHKVRVGLLKEMNEEETLKWLRYFSSWSE